MLSLVQLLEQVISNMTYRTGDSVLAQQVQYCPTVLPHTHEDPNLHINPDVTALPKDPSAGEWRQVDGAQGLAAAV